MSFSSSSVIEKKIPVYGHRFSYWLRWARLPQQGAWGNVHVPTTTLPHRFVNEHLLTLVVSLQLDFLLSLLLGPFFPLLQVTKLKALPLVRKPFLRVEPRHCSFMAECCCGAVVLNEHAASRRRLLDGLMIVVTDWRSEGRLRLNLLIQLLTVSHCYSFDAIYDLWASVGP